MIKADSRHLLESESYLFLFLTQVEVSHYRSSSSFSERFSAGLVFSCRDSSIYRCRSLFAASHRWLLSPQADPTAESDAKASFTGQKAPTRGPERIHFPFLLCRKHQHYCALTRPYMNQSCVRVVTGMRGERGRCTDPNIPPAHSPACSPPASQVAQKASGASPCTAVMPIRRITFTLLQHAHSQTETHPPPGRTKTEQTHT